MRCLAFVLMLSACGHIQPLPAGSFPAPQPPAPQIAAEPDWQGPLGEPLPQGPLAENTFARDDRQFVTSVERPWSSVGKLNTGCTATLIDARLVVTAAHCILDPRGNWMANAYVFYPNLIRGQARDAARATFVWYGTRTPLDGASAADQDWAILLLDRDLGAYGWMGIKDYSPAPGDKVTLVGYSVDADQGKTATAHVDCNVRAVSDGDFLHDCDMSRGASGGPLWSYAWSADDPSIVGVQSVEWREGGETSLHLASYDGSHPNGAVPASAFFQSAVWVIDRY